VPWWRLVSVNLRHLCETWHATIRKHPQKDPKKTNHLRQQAMRWLVRNISHDRARQESVCFLNLHVTLLSARCPSGYPWCPWLGVPKVPLQNILKRSSFRLLSFSPLFSIHFSEVDTTALHTILKLVLIHVLGSQSGRDHLVVVTSICN